MTLNERRIRLLERIGHYQERGQFPLVRELAADLGYRGESSISRMLDSLERDRYIIKYGGGHERRQRIYRLTPKGEAVVEGGAGVIAPTGNGLYGLPVLGSIPAGPLAEAVQTCEDFMNVGDSLRVQQGDFLLRVKGNSMSGDGILAGDLVLLRPGIQVNNGEIAGVQVRQSNGSYESTLKHVHFAPGRKTIRLRASNPRHGERVLPATEVEIVGVYRGLIRSLS